MKRLKPLLLPLIAVIAGACNTFAFAPYHFWIIQILALAILASLVIRTDKARTAFILGWAYGFGSLVSGIHWLFVSMHQYGGMNAPMAVTAVVLLSLFLGILAGFATGLTRFFMKRWNATNTVTVFFIFPAFWAIFEWVRGWIVTGLPWVVTGYAHTGSPLAGYAPIVGVYGICFIGAILAGAIALFFTIGREHWIKLLVASVLPIVVILVAGQLLRHVQWTEPAGQPIQVRLLQGNIPQEFKFTPEQINSALTMYADAITNRQADLIVTPETAIPLYIQQLPIGYLDHFSQFAARSFSHIALGIPLADSPRNYTNSLIVISPEDQEKNAQFGYRYNKHHLVPFGEFVPTGFHWFVNMMRIPLGDFTRGDPLQKPFAVKDQWIMPNICYEDIFGEEIVDQIRNEQEIGNSQPTILLNVSNIAWFGNTIALPQHLQISQMRSLETRRPMLRSTNTGATAVIDAQGNIQAQLTPYTRDELNVTLQGYHGSTPYIRYGNLLILAIAVLFLAVGKFASRRR